MSYTYFGHDTLTRVSIGNGRASWQRWGLMDHEGPYFQLEALGYPARRLAYLPLDLLASLYERFERANPGGVTLVDGDLFECDFLQGRYTEQEQENMYEQRRGLFNIDSEEPGSGYPHMRAYLPELFDPVTIERLAKDPSLDVELLRRAEHLGIKNGGIAENLWVDRSARWSSEWQIFCRDLSPQLWSPTNSWRVS